MEVGGAGVGAVERPRRGMQELPGGLGGAGREQGGGAEAGGMAGAGTAPTFKSGGGGGGGGDVGLVAQAQHPAGARRLGRGTVGVLVLGVGGGGLVLLFGLPGLDAESTSYFHLLLAPWLPLVTMLWFWGVNVQHWTEMRVNYARVFNQVGSSCSSPFIPCSTVHIFSPPLPSPIPCPSCS